LSEVERLLSSSSDGKDAGAIIIEPITSINGQIATPRFYKLLRKLATEHDVPFIVDETKTGMGASCKNWAYEHWYLNDNENPDFVTFGGKSGLSGFYSTLNYRLNDVGTSFE